MYEATINAGFRIRTLNLIDKTLALFDENLLRNAIRSQKSFAHFIYQIMRTKHLGSITICLETVRKMLDCDSQRFAVPLIREGVVNLIQDLSSEDSFKQAFGIRADISVTDENFDLEMHTLKETLAYLRVYSPEDHV